MRLSLNCALTSLLDSALWIAAQGLATGYIDVREHSGGDRNIDVDWSPIIEDLYSPELGNPLGCRGSACVDVMTTLHGSAPSLRRRAEGCILSEGMIPSIRDLLKSTHIHLEPPSPRRGLFVVPVLVQCPGLSGIEAAVIPPIVTPVTIIEDPHSHMDRLEQRIRQMRDPDEMISWDDPDDVPVATLPVSFRMPDIERYTGVGCPRIHLRLYKHIIRALGLDEAQLLTLFPLSLSGMTGDTSVTRRELEFLRQGSDEPISSFISRWREKTVEMIERPTERYHMSMFLRSLRPRFARHLTGVPFQDFRSLVQALLDVDDGISRGLCSAVPFCASSYCHGATSFQFQRPQTSIPRHEQSRPHWRRQRTYFDLGMPLDRAFERLIATGFLAPLAPRPPPSTLPPRFRAHEFCAFHQMIGHRTDYCASLHHTIQDLIDSGVPSPHMQFLLLRAYTITFGTPRALIFTRHFDIADLVVSESSSYPMFREVSDSFSVVTGPRAEIDDMMVMIFSEHIEIRLLQLRVSIVIERSSRSSDAFIATFDFIGICYFGYLTSTTSPTFSVPTAFLIHFIGYVDTTSIPGFEALQPMGFLAPLAPRALPDPVPSQFGLDLYSQAMHANAPSPAVPDLN
ncbi:hypothetical protein CK203_095822 [Vitis vinifera]|uniref:Retrotransposon gag domain-containing protein n=1 Tax=Vitis vinifera TaxID=29760 RepID=A0A438CK94_VITVI|nr:hypothetical protein CK203_095822 [Vitis vinifera]